MVDTAVLPKWDNESAVVHHNTKAECNGWSDLRDKVHRGSGNNLPLFREHPFIMEYRPRHCVGDVQYLFHIKIELYHQSIY